MNALQIVWFVILVFLLVGYNILAGFDLGAGPRATLSLSKGHSRHGTPRLAKTGFRIGS